MPQAAAKAGGGEQHLKAALDAVEPNPALDCLGAALVHRHHSRCILLVCAQQVRER